jgi:hypothetical protein
MLRIQEIRASIFGRQRRRNSIPYEGQDRKTSDIHAPACSAWISLKFQPALSLCIVREKRKSSQKRPQVASAFGSLGMQYRQLQVVSIFKEIVWGPCCKGILYGNNVLKSLLELLGRGSGTSN